MVIDLATHPMATFIRGFIVTGEHPRGSDR